MGTVCRTAIKQGEIGHTRIDDGVVKDRRTREQQFAVRGEVHNEFQPEELPSFLYTVQIYCSQRR